MSVYIVSFLQALKKFLVIISPEHSISAAIEGIVIDITYLGELEPHTVLPYHCVMYSVWPGPLFIVLYLALTANSLDTPVVETETQPI